MASSINASTSAGLVSTADTSGVLQLQTAGTTAVSVSAAQVVSFTNAPTISSLTSGRVTYAGTSGVLQDSANLTFTGSTLKVDASNPFVDISAAASTQGSLRIVGNGGTLGTNSFDFIQSTDQTGYIYNRANLPIIFGTNNVEAMRLTVNGTVILKGGTTAATGVGITFPATQSASSDANTLDDYEEGTWTATDASGAGLTFTNATQRYTRIGRIVTIQLDNLVYPATANASSSEIGGLPFAAAAGAGAGGLSSQTTNTIQIIILSGASSVRPYIVPSGNTRATNAQMSGVGLYMTITYSV
jgi:hypothetical protein